MGYFFAFILGVGCCWLFFLYMARLADKEKKEIGTGVSGDAAADETVEIDSKKVDAIEPVVRMRSRPGSISISLVPGSYDDDADDDDGDEKPVILSAPTDPDGRLVFFDCETTGLHSFSDRVIEFACIEMVGGKLTGREYQSYFRVRKRSSPGAFKAHGITVEFLQDKPRFKDQAETIADFLRGATLVAHNASFDVDFLDTEFGRANADVTVSDLAKEIVCTVRMSSDIFGTRKSLDALCKHYGIPLDGREKHGALIDVTLLSQVYLCMQNDLNS